MNTSYEPAHNYLMALRDLLDAQDGRGDLSVEEAERRADAAEQAWQAHCRLLDGKP